LSAPSSTGCGRITSETGRCCETSGRRLAYVYGADERAGADDDWLTLDEARRVGVLLEAEQIKLTLRVLRMLPPVFSFCCVPMA